MNALLTIKRMPVIMLIVFIFIAAISGCASVPMAPKEQDAVAKQFALPSSDKAGLYIFRNSAYGAALTRAVYLDGNLVGDIAYKTYLYQIIVAGNHTISTDSEFGKNDISLQAEGGKNYYVRQYIKLGVFRGGSNIEMVSEEEGKNCVLECGLAQSKQ